MQFQQLLVTLDKGQEELKTLLAEERKKKTKKVTRVLNMGRRFHKPDGRWNSHQHLKRGKEKVKELQCHLSLKQKKKRMRTILNSSTLRPMTNTRTWKND